MVVRTARKFTERPKVDVSRDLRLLKGRRAMQAMLTMKRIDIAAVERAAEGEPVS
jgi:hypothetical protein